MKGERIDARILGMLRCPVCGARTRVSDGGGSLVCTGDRVHCFDFAKSGYLNLSVFHSGGGDDREMVRARTTFLSAGYYRPVADGVLDALRKVLPDGGTVLDAGCGEGYYSCGIARGGYSVFGADLSKSAIDHAAKTARSRKGRMLPAQAVAPNADLKVVDPEASDSRAANSRVTDPEASDSRAANSRVTDPEASDSRAANSRVTDPEASDTPVGYSKAVNPQDSDPKAVNSPSAFFAVASLFDLPIADASADAIVSIFAPVAEGEFLRVLKPGGYLIVAGAGADHLMGLKRVLYDDPYRNEERADLPTGLCEVSRKDVREEITVEGEECIRALFSMTPYYWRTSAADRRKLDGLDTLTTPIDVRILTYRKDLS